MKSIKFLLMAIVAVLAGGAGAVRTQAQDVSRRYVYFTEGFSGTDPRYDVTVWNLEADTGYRRMYYSTTATTGGLPPEAVWGYVPSSGLNVVLRDTVRLVSKPFDLQADARSYVSMKYKYTSSKSSDSGIRSFGMAARQPGGDWVPCFVVGGKLDMSLGAEQLTAELPDAFDNATAVEVCVYLQNRVTPTELKNNYMLCFDDIEFYAYPAAYYDLAFSWGGRPYELTGFALDTVGFETETTGDRIDTVRVLVDTVFDTLAVHLNLNLENIGNTLQSGKIAYTFDDGAVQYMDFSFENPLLPGQAQTMFGFEPVGWAEASEGHHTVVFWLTEADGVALAETAVAKQRKVLSKVNPATATTYNYKPLVEEFSSSSCTSCAPRNKALQPIFNALGNRISVLKYQMNFPGNGDPYYTADGGVRKNFYDIKSVPEIYLNGRKEQSSGTEAMRLRFMEKIDAPAYFDMAFDTLALDADTNVYIALKVRSSVPMDGVSLQTVVIEGTTENNASTNGETSFHHVMLKMLPDGNGVKINLKPDTVYTFRYAYDMKKTFMEEADDLQVVCFLQADDDTVLQSAIGDVTMRIDAAPVPGVANEKTPTYTALSVYPNPASEEVCIAGLEAATVEVFNMAGRRVFLQYGVQGDYRLDVRHFRPGIYVIRVAEAGRTAWAKISVVR